MQSVPEKILLPYLEESLHWSAVDYLKEPSFLLNGFQSFRTIVGLGHYHLPFFLVLDLSILLEKGFQTPFVSDQQFYTWQEKERSIRLRYENEILSRILQEPLLREVLEYIHLEKDPVKRQAPLFRLLEILIHKFSKNYPQKTMMHPAYLRKITAEQLLSDERIDSADTFASWIQNPFFFLETLEEFVNKTSVHFRWSELLQKEDLFELENWQVLHTEELRIGCRQILEIERILGEINVGQVTIAEESAEVETLFVDETYYPTGGLSELTNRGSFENLVLSELAYMESGDGIDLFDVRFVEGELLYYLRNSGILRRKRRTIHIVLNLQQVFFMKSSGYSVAFSTLSQGFCLSMARDLLKIFENDAVHIHIHFVCNADEKEAYAKEMQLLQLLLQDEVKHGWVFLHLQNQIDLESIQEKKRKVYLLVFSFDKTEYWDNVCKQYRKAKQPLFGFHIPLLQKLQDQERLALPLEGTGMEELRELKNKILSALVGLKK